LLAVARDGFARDHLRLHREVGVEGVERVVDREREIAGDVGGGPHRVERGQVGMRHEGEGRGGLGAADARRGQRGCAGKGRFEDIASLHRRCSRLFHPF